MKFLTYVLLALSSFLIFSCKANKDVIDNNKKYNDNEVIMSLKKGPCFGRCPMYSMEILGNGLVKFKGDRFTDKLGKYELQLEEGEFEILKKNFEMSEFEGFKKKYESRLPDLPNVIIGFKSNDTLKLVSGKEGRPEVLMTLQKSLEEIAEGNREWKLIEPLIVDGEEGSQFTDSQIDPSRIVVRLSEDVNLPSWFNEMNTNYGLRILNRMDDSKRLWLVTYDLRRIQADALLKDLRKNQFVSEADYELKFKNK